MDAKPFSTTRRILAKCDRVSPRKGRIRRNRVRPQNWPYFEDLKPLPEYKHRHIRAGTFYEPTLEFRHGVELSLLAVAFDTVREISDPASTSSDDGNSSLEEVEESEQPYWDEIVNFTTTKGHSGWTVESVQAGDEIIVPSGSIVPFIVRFLAGDPETEEAIYEVIGDCYVEGIMFGELEEMVMSGQVETKTYGLW